MKNRDILQHIRSSVEGKKPLSSNIEFGEIAVNFAKDSGFTSFKDASGEVVTTSTDERYANKVIGFPKFSSTSTYTSGDVVSYDDGQLYEFTANHQAGAWNINQVTPHTVKSYVEEKIRESGIFDPTQYYTKDDVYNKIEVNRFLGYPAFSTATTYAIGDTVRYRSNNVEYIYEFIENHQAGAWNASQVKQISVKEHIGTKVDEEIFSGALEAVNKRLGTGVTSATSSSATEQFESIYDQIGDINVDILDINQQLSGMAASGGVHVHLNKPILDSITGEVYTKIETSSKTEIDDALATKLNTSGYTPLSSYYTKEEEISYILGFPEFDVYTNYQIGDIVRYADGDARTYYDWVHYKYSNGKNNPEDNDITKYNDTDGLTVLEPSDDAARANWGSDWRIPTREEWLALANAVNTEWTDDYQGSGVAGLICTDKTDSSKTLFLPAVGVRQNGHAVGFGSTCSYWSSSLNDATSAIYADLWNDEYNWDAETSRYIGMQIRPVSDGSAEGHDYVEIGGLKWATMNIGAEEGEDYGSYFQWGDTQGFFKLVAGDYLYKFTSNHRGLWNSTHVKHTDVKTYLNETISGTAYTKEEINSLLNDKLDVSAYTPTDLSNYYTKDEIDDTNQIIASSLNDLNNTKASTGFVASYAYDKTTIDELYYTKEEINANEKVISKALNDLNNYRMFNVGSNTVNTLNSIPTTKRLVIASGITSSNNTLTLSATLNEGYELYIIVNGLSGTSINLSPNMINTSGEPIVINNNGYCEISIISVANGETYYVRGV